MTEIIMTDFKKYTSIENYYQEKTLIFWLEIFPELKDVEFVIEEKIHGANMQFTYDPKDGESYWGRRKGKLSNKLDGYQLHGHRKATDKLEKIEHYVKQYAVWRNQKTTIYGELFGPGVQRMDYGPEKRILFFGLAFDDVLISQQQFYDWMYVNLLGDYIVPILSYESGFQAALNYNQIFPSKLSPNGNCAEGIVIKPLKKVFIDSSGSVFYLKKKNPKFNERSGGKKSRKVQDLIETPLLSYINQNRVDSVYSKEGRITDKKDMKKYINLVIDDAIEDYLKDEPDGIIDKQTKRGVSSIIARMLLKEF